MFDNRFLARALTWRLHWTLIQAAGIAFIFVVSGCEKPFSRSSFFKEVNPKAILTVACEREQVPLTVNFEFEETTLDYSLKECEAVIICGQTKRGLVLGDLTKRLNERIKTFGVTITGSGSTPDYSRERIPFRTSATAGQIIFYSTELANTMIKVNIVVFECRKHVSLEWP